MGDPIQYRRIFISYSGGNFALKRVESFKPDHDATSEVAKAIQGPIGYHHDDKGGTITLSVFAETGRPEVNYYALFASHEAFTLTTQDYPSGHRIQYHSVVVEKVGAPTENSGKQMLEVNCRFLGFRVLA